MARALKTPLFGKWLEAQRDGASREEFAIRFRTHAAKMGLKFDRSQVEKLEGGRLPSLPNLVALSRGLGLSLAELESMVISELASADDARDLLRPTLGVQRASVSDGENNLHASPPPARVLAERLRRITDTFYHSFTDVLDRLATGESFTNEDVDAGRHAPDRLRGA